VSLPTWKALSLWPDKMRITFGGSRLMKSAAIASEGIVSTDARTPVNYNYTPVLVDILQHLRASLAVSTYQAGKVLVIGAYSGRFS